MDKLIIYTDGACSCSKNIGGYGAVLIYKDYMKKIFGGAKNTTNNQMELKAVIEALKCVKTTHIPIEIYSDSEYIVKCFQQGWYHKWIYNNWRSAKSKVKNIDFWKELISLVEKQEDITFHKVKAHAGITLNELADDLANTGMDMELKKKN